MKLLCWVDIILILDHINNCLPYSPSFTTSSTSTLCNILIFSVILYWRVQTYQCTDSLDCIVDLLFSYQLKKETSLKVTVVFICLVLWTFLTYSDSFYPLRHRFLNWLNQHFTEGVTGQYEFLSQYDRSILLELSQCHPLFYWQPT